MNATARVERALAGYEPRRIAAGEGDRRAAVSLLLSGRETDLAILFVRRAEIDGDPWSGQMALPGGKMDPVDADLVETARRETWEEVGVRPDRDAFLGRLDDIHPMTRRLPSVVVSPFVVWITPETPIRTNEAEVQYHVWVPLPALADPAYRSEHMLDRHGDERVFPSILFDGDAIWGLTHRVVENFLEILERQERER